MTSRRPSVANHPIRAVARACAAMLLVTSAASASAALGEGSATMNYALTLSDGATRQQDMDFTSWEAQLHLAPYTTLIREQSPGASAGQYEAHDTHYDATAMTSVASQTSAFSGSLASSASMHGINGDYYDPLACGEFSGCVTVDTGTSTNIRLQPGQSFDFRATYAIKGSASGIEGTGEASAHSLAFFFFGSSDLPDGLSFQGTAEDTASSTSTSFNKSGTLLQQYTNPYDFALDFYVQVSVGTYATGFDSVMQIPTIPTDPVIPVTPVTPISPVPEPQTWALFGLGLAFVASKARRRNGSALAA